MKAKRIRFDNVGNLRDMALADPLTQWAHCPLCGQALAPERHSSGTREPSEPLFVVGNIVSNDEGLIGKLVDYWMEPGSRHWYTMRIDGRRLLDVAQEKLVLWSHR